MSPNLVPCGDYFALSTDRQGQFMKVATSGRGRPRPRDPLSFCNRIEDEAVPTPLMSWF